MVFIEICLTCALRVLLMEMLLLFWYRMVFWSWWMTETREPWLRERTRWLNFMNSSTETRGSINVTLLKELTSSLTKLITTKGKEWKVRSWPIEIFHPQLRRTLHLSIKIFGNLPKLIFQILEQGQSKIQLKVWGFFPVLNIPMGQSYPLIFGFLKGSVDT